MILSTSAPWRLAVTAGLLLSAVPLLAQQPVTAADYARAEQFLPGNADRLVTGIVRPVWIGETSDFWYRKISPAAGAPTIQFVLVDAATGTQQPAFDHAKLAASLGALIGHPLDPGHLPFPFIEISSDLRTVTIPLGSRTFRCDRLAATCAPLPPDLENAAVSPDGKRAVFIRDWNLWLYDLASGRETQLTHDGVENFGYATNNAGWISSDSPVVLWSPDSTKIATFQQDQRGDGDMYLVETRLGHPVLHAWKYPLVGDPVVTTIQRVIIDVDTGAMVRLKMPPDQHRSTVCDDITCSAGPNGAPLWADVEWSPDSKTLAFVSTSRDHKVENLRVANAATGDVREVYEEKCPTQFESGDRHADWRYLPQSNEFLWYSERDNWGHLYLYDLATGRLKNKITTGPWKVSDVLRVDDRSRQIWFTAVGRNPGEDPYYFHLYRIDFDGQNLTPLTPEPGDHSISASASGRYFVDSTSTPQTPPATVLRDDSGKVLLSFGHADISRLRAMGWQPPISIHLKARDGHTDLYGLLFEPTHLDKSRKYPLVDHIYPGPQVGSVGSRAFDPARADCQALAELGFVVFELDGMGTNLRSKSFHDVSYGNMGDNTLPDQVAAIPQLARQFPWIDTTRVGIYGHSGGGNASAEAILRYPKVFSVAIAESGNHDNREYEDDWGERYQGLLVTHPDGTTNYDDQANEDFAKNLEGHLLIADGTMDNNVPPYNTLLLVDALVRANKEFDLVLLPNQHHGYGADTNYMTRRRWDYFVRWLLDTEPPPDFRITAPPPIRGLFGGPSN